LTFKFVLITEDNYFELVVINLEGNSFDLLPFKCIIMTNVYFTERIFKFSGRLSENKGPKLQLIKLPLTLLLYKINKTRTMCECLKCWYLCRCVCVFYTHAKIAREPQNARTCVGGGW